jgi:hypothetical protein
MVSIFAVLVAVPYVSVVGKKTVAITMLAKVRYGSTFHVHFVLRIKRASRNAREKLMAGVVKVKTPVSYSGATIAHETIVIM